MQRTTRHLHTHAVYHLRQDELGWHCDYQIFDDPFGPVVNHLCHTPTSREPTTRFSASDGPIGFQHLEIFAAEHGIDGTKMAAILTDLIRSGHVALVDEGNSSGFSFLADGTDRTQTRHAVLNAWIAKRSTR